jgi:protein O-mannosyl-transferase
MMQGEGEKVTLRTGEKQPSTLALHLLAGLVVVAAAFAIYWQLLGHEFLSNWDDDKYVTANEAVKGISFAHLRAAFTRAYVGNYAPFQIISYMVDHSVWGLRASGFYLTNILLHAMNGLLLYALVHRCQRSWYAAVIAALLFVVHPVQVESVAWISQRKNLLAMTFFLLALLLYAAYRERGRLARAAYLCSLLAYAAALLTKSVTVILPVVLVLYDLRQPARQERRFADKVPYLLAAAGAAALTLVTQRAELEGGRAAYHGGSPWNTLLTMLTVLTRYLQNIIWPARLSAFYQVPIRTGVDGQVLLGAALLATAAVVGVILFRRQRQLFFWYALFFVGLAPVSQVVPIVTLMNDRYLYFPLLGVAASCGLVLAFPQLAGRWRRPAATLACAVVILLGLAAFQRARVWTDAITLWQDAVAMNPDSKTVFIGLAEAYHNAGRLDEARPAYLSALSLSPGDPNVLNNLGVLYLDKGEPLKARPFLEQVLAEDPRSFDGLLNLGNSYFLEGKLAKAEELFLAAATVRPTAHHPFKGLGNVYLRRGEVDRARELYRRSLVLGGDPAGLNYDLACTEAVAGRLADSLRHLDAALQSGFRNGAELRDNQDLAALRSTPEFQRLLEKFAIRR